MVKCFNMQLSNCVNYLCSSKPIIRRYYNEEVHWGGIKGDSVKLELTGCIASLSVGEIKVYKVAHCHHAEDGCGELCVTSAISYSQTVHPHL